MGETAVRPQVKGFDAYPAKLGDLLRGERATKGKSLLDVQRELRIKAIFIAAIENCDASAFSTPGFIAGYVRSYARYLDLDPDTIFDRFCVESKFDRVKPRQISRPIATGSAPIRAIPAQGIKVDPLSTVRTPFAPVETGLLDGLSLSGIGSVMVLLALILGLGYGAWSVLQNIQKVEFVPSESSSATAAAAPYLQAPDKTKQAALERLYRPQALEVPVMVPRDGPIANLDPSRIGALLPGNGDGLRTSDKGVPVVAEAPRVMAPKPPTIAVIATRPAWVRISRANGSILFEKILNGGESFQLPQSAQDTVLRAGNAGAVYLSLDGKAFGPVGQGVSVVKNVALAVDSVKGKYPAVKNVAALKALASPSVITLNDKTASQ